MLGVAQGAFLSLLLLTKQNNVTPNRLFAVAMIVFSLGILSSLFHAARLYLRYPSLIGVLVPLPFLYGPVIYLYARTLSKGSTSISRWNFLHLIPFVLNYLWFIPKFSLSAEEKIGLMQTIATSKPIDIALIDDLKIVHGLIYMTLTFHLLQHYGSMLKERYSSIEGINLVWLRRIATGIASIWAIVAILEVMRWSGIHLVSSIDMFVALALPMFVYVAGYLGLRQPEIIHQVSVLPFGSADTATLVQSETTIPPSMEETGTGAYRKSGLTEERARAYELKLADYLDRERPFTKNNLTLEDLAEPLSISEHNLSEVINSRFGMNFYDLINSYRVRDVESRLRNPANENFTLLAIAFDAGFSSKSSFNAVFKKQTGMTPSEYRNQLASKSG